MRKEKVYMLQVFFFRVAMFLKMGVYLYIS